MKCVCNLWRVSNLLGMVLRINKSLKNRELLPTPDWSGPAPTFVTFYNEYSTPRVSSTMPEMTTLRCPEYSCRKTFISDRWQLDHMKLHHPEHLEVAGQMTLTVRSAPRSVDPAQCREFNANKDSVKYLDLFPNRKHLEIIADSESQPPPPPPLPPRATHSSAGAALSDGIPEPWERDADGFLESNLPNNPYYPFATHEVIKYIQCGIEKKGIRTYYDNVLKERNTALCFPIIENRDCVQKLVASMAADLAIGEWELHTLEDMKWNDNHSGPIKYWSRDIIKSMRWLMWPHTYSEHVVYAAQHCFNSATQRTCLYTEMHTVTWWWAKQVKERYPSMMTC